MKIVIVGAGGVGRHLASAFSGDADVVLVDCHPDILAEAEAELDVLTLVGDGVHRDVLRKARVAKADLVVAVTGSDPANLACAALSVDLGAASAVARVDDPDFYDLHTGIERGLLGVDVMCASRLVSNELLRRVSQTHARFVTAVAGGAHEVAGFRIDGASRLLGKSPGSIKLRAGCRVVAVWRGSVVRPAHEIQRIDVDDTLVFVGPAVIVPGALHDLNPKGAGRSVIVGGGEVGAQVAEVLAETERDVRVIDSDRARCEALAANLSAAAIVHGDGTHLALLRDEQIGEASTFVATTKSDEVNLMSSLLSQQLGVTDTFALVQRPGYARVYEHLGIRGTTSVHEVFARAVRWLMPSGTFARRERISGTDAEIVETHIPEDLRRKLVLRDVALPARTIPLLLLDGTDGVTSLPLDTVLQGGEYLVAIVRNNELDGLERALERVGRSGGG